MDHGAKLFVCGDGSKMAPYVEETLEKAYHTIHGVNEEKFKI
ncbi:hypothetical protein [Paenibacillus baekrokdamisoli]|nr:hypothetical protein [Paenibacillus baekrokdamisoli]